MAYPQTPTESGEAESPMGAVAQNGGGPQSSEAGSDDLHRAMSSPNGAGEAYMSGMDGDGFGEATEASSALGLESVPGYEPNYLSEVATLTEAQEFGEDEAGEEGAIDAYYASQDESSQEFFGALLPILAPVLKQAAVTAGGALVKTVAGRIGKRLRRPRRRETGGDEAGTLLEVVIGEDDRVPVNNTTAQPWNGICQLTIRARNGKTFFGTGWLIGPRTVITAGHCVYLHGAGGWASKVEVSAGRNGSSKPYGTVVSSRYSSVGGWVKSRSRDHDYGVIFLPQQFAPVGAGAAPFQFKFAAMSDANLKGRVMNLSGYPADNAATGKNGIKQWFHARQATQVTPRTIVYDIDTGGGQSGSPVWTLQGGQRCAVGIHTNGFHIGNSATRITAAVAANLEKWKQQSMPQLKVAAE